MMLPISAVVCLEPTDAPAEALDIDLIMSWRRDLPAIDYIVAVCRYCSVVANNRYAGQPDTALTRAAIEAEYLRHLRDLKSLGHYWDRPA